MGLVEEDLLPILIKDLLEKVKAPFNVNSLTDTDSGDLQHFQDLEFFPSLPVVRSRGDFCFDTNYSPNKASNFTAWYFLGTLPIRYVIIVMYSLCPHDLLNNQENKQFTWILVFVFVILLLFLGRWFKSILLVIMLVCQIK